LEAEIAEYKRDQEEKRQKAIEEKEAAERKKNE
jgi:hypothetical protein